MYTFLANQKQPKILVENDVCYAVASTGNVRVLDKSTFWSRIEFFVKNWNLDKKSKFSSKEKFRSKIQILVKSRTFGQR